MIVIIIAIVFIIFVVKEIVVRVFIGVLTLVFALTFFNGALMRNSKTRDVILEKKQLELAGKFLDYAIESDKKTKSDNIKERPSKLNLEKEEENNGIGDIELSVSSQLASSGNLHYGVNNLLYNNFETSWVEGKDGAGIGETIRLDFSKESSIEGVSILNGYGKNDYLYYVNNKVKKMRVKFSNNESEIINLEDDKIYEQRINFSKKQSCRYVIFEILEVYEGNKLRILL